MRYEFSRQLTHLLEYLEHMMLFDHYVLTGIGLYGCQMNLLII
jgi:hypothetical protein